MAPDVPLGATTNSNGVTPVTSSLNVTVKFTLVALVGSASASAMETTLGGVWSIPYASPVVKSPFPGFVPPRVTALPSLI